MLEFYCLFGFEMQNKAHFAFCHKLFLLNRYHPFWIQKTRKHYNSEPKYEIDLNPHLNPSKEFML